MAEEKEKSELLNSFLQSDFNSPSYRGPAKDYMQSEERKNKYEELTKEDDSLSEFLRSVYGSSETFFEFNKDLQSARIFSPGVDFNIEVEIVTKNDYYKSNFISSSEMFFEILGGVCTVQYYKTDGRADQMVVTLKRELVPSSQHGTRLDAFQSLGKNRLLVWNLQKEKWASFYVQNVVRFVRDDTSYLQ